MKDLQSVKYWTLVFDLGSAMGRASLPTLEEAASTVLDFIGQRNAETARADYAEKELRVLKQKVVTLLMKFSNEAEDLRHHVQCGEHGRVNPESAQQLPESMLATQHQEPTT